jgi:hypothetical protein
MTKWLRFRVSSNGSTGRPSLICGPFSPGSLAILMAMPFETQSEAEAAQKAMLPVVRVAKLITPHVIS